MTKLYNKGDEGLADNLFEDLTTLENRKTLIYFFSQNENFLNLSYKEQEQLTVGQGRK